MPLIYFETTRVIVRQWNPQDAPELFKIMSDDRVHTYTGDSSWSLERCEKYIKLMTDKNFRTLETFHGACVLKESNTIIGFTGLNPYKDKQPELEWQLGVQFWNKGYATELGKAIIENAFKTTDIKRIYGIANPKNKSSMRVLEKIGMKCIGLQEFRGHQDMFYRIDRL